MSAAALIVTETCPYCTRGRSVLEMMPFAGTRICFNCYRAHEDALRAISAGTPPKGCSECNLTWQQLCERAGIQPDQQASMQVHYENGVYRFMCRACSRDYIRKRTELYGPTPFGYRVGLK